MTSPCRATASNSHALRSSRILVTRRHLPSRASPAYRAPTEAQAKRSISDRSYPRATSIVSPVSTIDGRSQQSGLGIGFSTRALDRKLTVSSSIRFSRTADVSHRPLHAGARRIAIHTLGIRGDAQPYVALARSLKARGQQVQLAAPVQFSEFAADHGVSFRALPAELLALLNTAEGKATVAGGKGFSAGFKLLKEVRPSTKRRELVAAFWPNRWSNSRGRSSRPGHALPPASAHALTRRECYRRTCRSGPGGARQDEAKPAGTARPAPAAASCSRSHRPCRPRVASVDWHRCAGRGGQLRPPVFVHQRLAGARLFSWKRSDPGSYAGQPAACSRRARAC